MSSLIEYDVVGWLITRGDNSQETVLGTLDDSHELYEGDEAVPLVAIKSGSIPALLGRIDQLET